MLLKRMDRSSSLVLCRAISYQIPLPVQRTNDLINLSIGVRLRSRLVPMCGGSHPPPFQGLRGPAGPQLIHPVGSVKGKTMYWHACHGTRRNATVAVLPTIHHWPLPPGPSSSTMKMLCKSCPKMRMFSMQLVPAAAMVSTCHPRGRHVVWPMWPCVAAAVLVPAVVLLRIG